MDHYATYEVTDFILDEPFVNWVKSPTAASDRVWQQWLAEHPDRVEVVEEARFWIQHVSVREQLPSDREVQAVIQTVQQQLAEEQTGPVRSIGDRMGAIAWRVAAAVLLLIGLAWYVRRERTMESSKPEVAGVLEKPTDRISRENRTSKPLSLTLPDGSRVVLAAKSVVTHPRAFTAPTRDIELTGEAFFEVVRRTEQPFVVHTGTVNVRVLGTSFVVKAYGHARDVSVAVKSGKVAVSKSSARTDERTAGVLLTPNQQVSFSLQDQVFRKSLVEAPILIDKRSREADFVFDEAPVAQVFQKLEAAYKIDLVYNPDELKNCTLTAQLANEPLYEKLNNICRAIGASHETVGTQIIIHGDSCSP
ncbi:FecR family protein [Larkinella harenae]